MNYNTMTEIIVVTRKKIEKNIYIIILQMKII